jgi:hypothetical protein
LESGDEAESLCLGIFDNCKDVLKILASIKEAVTKKTTISINAQTKTDTREFYAYSLELENETYESIIIRYYPDINTIHFDPSKYEIMDEDALNSEGKSVHQKGFSFSVNGKRVFYIQIGANDIVYAQKEASLKKYLFGNLQTNDNSLTSNKDNKKTAIEPIIPTDDFVSQGSGDCFATCKKIMSKYDPNYSVSYNLWALATTNGTSKTYIHKECYEKAIIALDNLLDGGKPVMVGVDYKSGSSNFDGITDHWVIITGRNNDDNGTYYTYFEVAQSDEKGTSTDQNRFYLNANGYLEGLNPTVNSAWYKPIVTVIRVEPNNCACDRNNYDNKEPKEMCGSIYNHRTSPKGTLIKIRD